EELAQRTGGESRVIVAREASCVIDRECHEQPGLRRQGTLRREVERVIPGLRGYAGEDAVGERDAVWQDIGRIFGHARRRETAHGDRELYLRADQGLDVVGGRERRVLVDGERKRLFGV